MANQNTRQVSSASLEGVAHLIRSILIQLSGLAGILAFLAQMWAHAPLDQSLLTGTIVGGGVYMILLLVDMGIQRIIAAHLETEREKARARQEARIESIQTDEEKTSGQNTDASPESAAAQEAAPSDEETSSPSTSSPADQEMVTA